MRKFRLGNVGIFTYNIRNTRHVVLRVMNINEQWSATARAIYVVVTVAAILLLLTPGWHKMGMILSLPSNAILVWAFWRWAKNTIRP